VVRQAREHKVATFAFFLELDAGREAHGRPSSDWGRKVIGYDRFYSSHWTGHPELGNLPAFPAVAVITHGEQRLLNLARAILDKRERPVCYYLAWWPDLRQAEDLLTAPAWLVITPEGKFTGEKPAARKPLLPPDAKPRRRPAGKGKGA